MAFMTINYKSPTIGMNQSFTAIVPEDDSFFKQNEPVKPLKMLLLLHGLSSDAT
ncbi:esterase family protein, partial [Staphylococcus hominis]|nr:esterase family protein [Staphylococcus hominis]